MIAEATENYPVKLMINGNAIYLNVLFNPRDYKNVEDFIDKFKADILEYCSSTKFQEDSSYVAMVINPELKWGKADETLRGMWNE